MTTARTPFAAVVALGVTQIIAYGTLYYSFSILAPDMARDLGWSREWVFGALSAALLAGGFAAPWFGRLIDQYGAGRMMSAGSLLAAAALAACAAAPNGGVFVAALIALELASNLVQYGAAFALLVQLRPQVAARSITYLTLIGGFASTVFWPITTALHQVLTWQQVYLVFAALNLVVCLPLHGWLSTGLARSRAMASAMPAPVVGQLPDDRKRIGFALMVTGFALQSLVGSAILVHMVPLLSGLGLGASAALIGTLFGPSQVVSRLINMGFGRNLSPVILAVIAATLMPIGVAVLAWTAPSVAGAMAFAILFGLGNGLLSIVSGTLPLHLFGSEGYGRLQGKVNSARLVVSATAPFALAFGMIRIGVVPSLAIAVMAGALAVLAFLMIRRA
ncbi:arsenite efflux MFS transporter ArsK [Mesorhizobium sp. 1M-11]|uniref:arsenite efflux MFS transporter ArsK n=1 Tax=Mesorhizobium sp. 1M-11 TaxID=1529006 RepID=UPI0006C7368B|nr:arsenite efflux MFS transporter ArsK [Mesorhizobium sp. 1M-11]